MAEIEKPMMNEHTAKAFDSDLQELTRKVAEMGGLAEREIADAIQALTRRDIELAKRVVAADPTIDALQQEIEEKAVLTIARRQPMAVDLREIVAALRVSNDLERIGDLAKNIGKRVGALEGDFYPSKLLRGVEHMASLVLGQLKHVLDAYASRDLPGALAVWKGDEEIDAMCTSLFRELLTYMMEDPRNITFCIHLMFCAKNIERMGDHATNIAETVHYMVEGRPIADPRPKGDTTAFAKAAVAVRKLAMGARILIVEDEEPLALLLRYNLEAEGYDVETIARGDEADTRLPRSLARSRRARLDAAGPVRHRAVPEAADAAREQGAADHHAHRARRGKRARPRTGDRRRRLHRQAVLGARADRSRARVAAPRFARACRQRA